MQRIKKLPLQLPGELRAIKIAGMNGKYVRVHRCRGILQVDKNFDEAVDFPR